MQESTWIWAIVDQIIKKTILDTTWHYARIYPGRDSIRKIAGGNDELLQTS